MEAIKMTTKEDMAAAGVTPVIHHLDFEQADSKEEVYFSWWLDELQMAGFIRRWYYQAFSFSLSDRVQYKVKKHLKTKVRVDDKLLLHPHSYTPDFLIQWCPSAYRVFYNDIGDMADLKSCPIVAQNTKSWIDVKPKQWGNNSFMEAFRLNQKWTFDRYHTYVQPVVVFGQKTSLFESTFTPRRFFTTDKSGRPRKINFKARSLAEFVEVKGVM